MKNFDSAVKLNRLGMSHFARGELVDAIKAYREAIDIRPDYTDAYYNLGLALVKIAHKKEAMAVYEALIALSSQHLGARFQLGCLFMEQNNDKMAIEHFAVIMQAYPEHVETQINLASCYLRLGNINEAKSLYIRAIEREPTDKQSLFNLGVISMQQGRMKDAIEYYLQVLKLDSYFYDAHNNLGVTYLTVKDIQAALLHFQTALQLQPTNEVLRHTVDVLMRQKKLSASPVAYIRALFDSYASHYDGHLVKVLQYQVPQQLYAMVQAYGGDVQRAILDLGCGTGLTGELFKSCANRLIGVDLSEKMLAVASQKQLYDELVESDILLYLANKTAEFDLIVAGDVLVYFGDLVSVFAAVFQALKSQGLFVFNVEVSEKEEFAMTNSGRFVHHKHYLDQLAFENHLRVLQYQVATMRVQDDVPVQGHFYLLQRHI